MILYDIHTHKNELKERASGYQVRSLISVSPNQFLSDKELQKYDFFSCGIHPWATGGSDKEIESLIDIAQDERVLAIGEVGLDKLRGASIKEQIEVFRAQIRLAISLHKPLVIHCVKAWNELIALRKEFKADIPWILHGYRGGVEQTKQLVKFGFEFSIGEKYNRESLAHIPLDSIFCETDDSEISIRKVYERVSMSLGLSFEQFAEKMEGNTRKYFRNMTK